MATKDFTVCIGSDMLHKLRYVADYEGRSANSQILILIRDCILKHEKKHGQLKLKKKFLKQMISKKFIPCALELPIDEIGSMEYTIINRI